MAQGIKYILSKLSNMEERYNMDNKIDEMQRELNQIKQKNVKIPQKNKVPSENN